MKRALVPMVAALAVMLIGTGCFLVVEAPATTVEVQNDLTALQVDVNGTISDIDGIDLNSVVIGDVEYAYIGAGARTAEKITSRRGTVEVRIGSADAIVVTHVLGVRIETVFSFPDIDPMEVTINEGAPNTVVFDQATAGVIFSALAKKR